MSNQRYQTRVNQLIKMLGNAQSPADYTRISRALQAEQAQNEAGAYASAGCQPSGNPAFGGSQRADGAYMHTELPPDRFMRVSGISSIALSTQLAVTMEFSAGAGWIVGMRGTILTPTSNDNRTAGMGSIGLGLTLNGQEELMTNGTTADFPIFETLFPASGGSATYSLFMRHFDIKDKLTCTFKNFSTTTAFTPDLTFAFRMD